MKSEEKLTVNLRVASDAFTEGLVVVDTELPGQPIVFVNEGWEKITGYSTEEVLGMHCGSLLQVLGKS